MTIATSSIEIAQDLIHIHKDMIKLYLESIHETNRLELDLKAIFERIIEQSMKYKQQLNEKITNTGTAAGEIYKSWMDARSPVSSDDKKSVLTKCSIDELAVLNAYSIAVSKAGLEPDILELLKTQLQGVKELYTHIKQYHDAQ